MRPDESRYNLDDLIPHRASMSLLDEVLEAGEEGLTARVTIRPGSAFYEADSVPAWVGIEYMAQAMAAFAGLEKQRVGETVKIGFLLGTRRYETAREIFREGEELIIEVERLYQEDSGLGCFAGTIRIAGETVAESRLNVFEPPDTEAFLQEQH